ncbi:hypothetical protein N6L24_15535 [Cognatishimia sp. SS12]|nr:hypothetical protein [Cognatishimia sp. SS12]
MFLIQEQLRRKGKKAAQSKACQKGQQNWRSAYTQNDFKHSCALFINSKPSLAISKTSVRLTTSRKKKTI